MQDEMDGKPIGLLGSYAEANQPGIQTFGFDGVTGGSQASSTPARHRGVP
jgi:hypothetical protein